MTETESTIVRILRQIQRTQAKHTGKFEAFAEELDGLRHQCTPSTPRWTRCAKNSAAA